MVVALFSPKAMRAESVTRPLCVNPLLSIIDEFFMDITPLLPLRGLGLTARGHCARAIDFHQEGNFQGV